MKSAAGQCRQAAETPAVRGANPALTQTLRSIAGMVNFPQRIAMNEMALRRYIIALLFWRPERETLPRLAQRLVAARVVTHQFDAPPLEPKVRAYMMEGAACVTLI